MHDDGADPGVIVRLERTQHAMLFGGKMRERMTVVAKHVVVEERLPGLPLSGRPLGDGDHAEQQAGIGRIRAGLKGIPPIIDQPVEGCRGFDLMPP